MTRDRLDEIFQHYADIGVDVEWRDLGSKKRGEYDWYVDKVIVSLRLDQRQLLSCLAHELGHRHFGDRCSTPAVERRAWEYAAAFLITPSAYQRAEAFVGHQVSALAIELGVTPKVIEAWRRWWEKRGKALAGGQYL